MNLFHFLPGIFDKNIRHMRRFQSPSATVNATVEALEDRTIIRAGQREIFIRTLNAPQPVHQTADFAVFALAVISMSTNTHITLQSPVTPAAVKAIAELTYATKLWMMPRIAPLRLTLANVVNTPLPQSRKGGILCLSGGVDSTAIAVTAATEGYDHALLIAGADYPTAQSPGYLELQSRVQSAADKLGLRLLQIETDIRKQPFSWEMLHSFNLAFCLHYLSPHFANGAFALDNTPVQDLARHPWGNSAPLAGLFGIPDFAIAGLGGNMDRVEKVAFIHDIAPQVLPHLSVCWQNIKIGGNCGVCNKCTQTRLNLLCAGVDDRPVFPKHPPLADLIPKLKFPRHYIGLRGFVIRMSEITLHLPEGPLRDAAVKVETRALRRLARMNPKY